MSRVFIRTPLACNTCRRRKTKCNGIRPRCGHCRVKQLQCSWAVPDGIDVGPSQKSPDLASEPLDSEVHFGASSTLIVPLETVQNGFRLCLDHFFKAHFVNDFCSFDDRLDFTHKCANNNFLSTAVIALCGRYLEANDAYELFSLPSGREVSKAYIPRARSLAKAVADEASVTNIQGNLILGMAELLANSGSRHWLFAGTAIRMAEIMRLNKEFHQKHGLKEQEIRRRVYWACLIFDRALAYLLAKHRTINLDIVSIALPGTESSLAYQEESVGITLDTVADHRRPSDLGLSSFLIKTICIWSDMADFAVYSRRRLEWYPPTDSRSGLFIQNSALEAWVASLPQGLLWTPQNFKMQQNHGQEKVFVALHFLIQTASCVAYQCYLPHLTAYTNLVDLVDAAGWSYMHRDLPIIRKCVSSALKVGEMLSQILSIKDDRARSALQSVWVASASLVSANVFLWVVYSQDEAYLGDEIQKEAQSYFEMIVQLISSWRSEWKAARQWLTTLHSMQGLYKAAYVGELNDNILSPDDHETSESDSDSDSATDFRPQPGDGFPSLIAMPNLQASVKFATCDTSAKAISVQSVWLQLSSGWPYALASHDGFLPTSSTVSTHTSQTDSQTRWE